MSPAVSPLPRHRLWLGPLSTAYVSKGADLEKATTPEQEAAAIWLDLRNPDQATLDRVGAELGAELPTIEDMEEIETSSRLYTENGVGFLTASVPFGLEGAEPRLAPVAFVITANKLVTIRHHDHKAFATFPPRARYVTVGCGTSSGVLLGLLDAIADRIADILEHAARDIDAISHAIFRPAAGPKAKNRNFQRVLEEVGRQGDLLSKLRESLSSFERLFGFLGQLELDLGASKEMRAFVKTLSADARSLIEQAEFDAQKITLLLDATLGMINIEQSGIIKIVSVVSVVFMPPTLVASIYGMNFEAMPELDWVLGYPFAIALMIVFAILPYVFFKMRGWL